MSEQPYIPPPHGWRTFLIVWATQSISVFGSALTFFTITVWLTQTVYPRPDQQADLAFALAAVSLAFGLVCAKGFCISGIAARCCGCWVASPLLRVEDKAWLDEMAERRAAV